MRAVLVLIVLLAWVACLVGAVVLPAYLLLTAIRRRRGQAPPPPLGTVPGLVAFAAVMATAAVVLAVLALRDEQTSSWSDALAWAALPLWTAFVASLTAMVLARRRRPAVAR